MDFLNNSENKEKNVEVLKRIQRSNAKNKAALIDGFVQAVLKDIIDNSMTYIFDAINQVKLSEDSYKKANDKRKDYVNDNIAWASDEYKQDNINNFNYFQMANDLDEIKDKVRHSNFKEQCEFFNEEFNQFGIEFIYISP